MAKTFVEIKKLFVDQTAIRKELNRKSVRTLFKFGAYVRKTAQHSMKSRKRRHSAPGEPPYAHGNKFLKKFYFFVVDIKAQNVVVGPVRLSQYSDLKLPSVLEHGGTITNRYKSGKIRTAAIAPRPYTAPAVAKHLPEFGKWFADA